MNTPPFLLFGPPMNHHRRRTAFSPDVMPLEDRQLLGGHPWHTPRHDHQPPRHAAQIHHAPDHTRSQPVATPAVTIGAQSPISNTTTGASSTIVLYVTQDIEIVNSSDITIDANPSIRVSQPTVVSVA